MQKPSPYVSGGEYSLNSEFTLKAKYPKTWTIKHTDTDRTFTSQQLDLDMKQKTDSKFGKEYVKVVHVSI